MMCTLWIKSPAVILCSSLESSSFLLPRYNQARKQPRLQALGAEPGRHEQCTELTEIRDYSQSAAAWTRIGHSLSLIYGAGWLVGWLTGGSR